jgi:hypothetical protein
MAISDMYRKQHREILEVGAKLGAMLNEAGLQADAAPARQTLSQLAGKVKVHLAMEDKSVYPQLAASKKPQTATTATKFKQSMGGLVDVFLAFDKKYAMPKDISSHPADFIKEAKVVMGALGERIKKEEAELYMLLDQE